ncbi:type II secretion system protein [Sulfurirhabdus autotrophica]|uniref:Prepilin-type N-terminal cleavage/methylation domain-containing protein n=1 Tax=Sulfurirhabdus autotrophica TaxID=1706046 RepID=A0A4R3XRD0_9PROT|nr:prepilin-type N-terminal cleavage/methylation domain-containing protein [Sulfurirhabdus autotrophica]TCV80080.1 prepilin-type N-terminal cleavage/methylation domain-containing protein [Sulfurirhabdus autotrophica]
MQNQKGFTLIEIAIVLVIIGLILGGVLKGQEMITQAKIRNVANDLNGVSAAYYGYQDRYRAIPGDDPNAETRWTSAVTVKGNGDGVVTVTPVAPATVAESNLFWQHLRLSGFISGPTNTQTPPTNSVGGITTVQTGAFGLTGLVVCTSNLPAAIANAIDSQFDDGIGTTGQVRGGTTLGPAASDAADYVDDGVKRYTVCKNI